MQSLQQVTSSVSQLQYKSTINTLVSEKGDRGSRHTKWVTFVFHRGAAESTRHLPLRVPLGYRSEDRPHQALNRREKLRIHQPQAVPKTQAIVFRFPSMWYIRVEQRQVIVEQRHTIANGERAAGQGADENPERTVVQANLCAEGGVGAKIPYGREENRIIVVIAR
ncbi:hypothetical protein C8R46DRAFT_1028464 [Mycena filopes]|nr:hypothetical protein C8R46DRAFT_1028464 [Mycena filopes]